MHIPKQIDQNTTANANEASPRRALPGRTIDLIRDGVQRDTIRDRGHDPAVWSALISTAMSAVNRQWAASDFISLVLEPRSHLGAQAALKNGKSRGGRQTIELLHKAWQQARDNVERTPAVTSADLSWAARRNVQHSVHQLATLDVTDSERLVMLHVARRLMDSGSVQTAISRRDFIDATGLGQTALETAQRKLVAKGHLVQVEKGRPSGPSARRRRAHVWALPAASASASVGVRAHSSNTGNRFVAPPPRSGAPRSTTLVRDDGNAALGAVPPAHVEALVDLLVGLVGAEALADRLRGMGASV